MRLAVRITTIIVWVLCLLSWAFGVLILWLSVGVSKSAVQETDAAAQASVFMIGGYVFARAVTAILKAIAPIPHLRQT